MTRLCLTLKAQVEAFKANALCPQCFKPYRGSVEFDHDIALAAGGKDHDESPLMPLCKACHALKTKKDRKIIAKIKRQKGETGQRARRAKRGPVLKGGRKLESRDFDKRFKKRMDGKVIPRHAG